MSIFGVSSKSLPLMTSSGVAAFVVSWFYLAKVVVGALENSSSSLPPPEFYLSYGFTPGLEVLLCFGMDRLLS